MSKVHAFRMMEEYFNINLDKFLLVEKCHPLPAEPRPFDLKKIDAFSKDQATPR